MIKSDLVPNVLESPNKNKLSNKVLKRLTPHYIVCDPMATRAAKSVSKTFSKPSREASSNYVIDNGGLANAYCCVGEEDRAWTSSSRANDSIAITFEIAGNQEKGMSPEGMKAFYDLAADICRRWKKKGVKFCGSLEATLEFESNPANADILTITQHCWFANTSCPGNHMKELEMNGTMEAEINSRLGYSPSDDKPTGNKELLIQKWEDKAYACLIDVMRGRLGNGGTRRNNLYKVAREVGAGEVEFQTNVQSLVNVCVHQYNGNTNFKLEPMDWTQSLRRYSFENCYLHSTKGYSKERAEALVELLREKGYEFTIEVK